MQDASPIKHSPSDSAKDASSDAQSDVSNQVHCGQNLQILPKNSEIQMPNFPQFLCEICNFEAPNQSFLEMHFTKRQHRKRHKTKSFFCKVCDVKTYDNGSFEEHLNGKKHKKKSEMSERHKFICEICNIVTTNQDGLDMHLFGKQHKKIILEQRRLKLDAKSRC